MTKKFFVHTLLLFLLSCFSVARAQHITVELDKDKILIGGQVTLQFKLEDYNPRLFTLQGGWFNMPDTINNLEVVKRSKIDTISAGGYVTYVQKLTITSFDSGSWKFPPFGLSLLKRGDTKPIELKAPYLTLDVLTVDVMGMKEYHPVKDIAEVDIHNNPWLILVLAVMSIVSGITLRWFIRVRKRAHKMATLSRMRKRGRSPLYRATQQFTALKKTLPIPFDQIKDFYTQVEDICRNYLSEMFLEETLQSTSSEIMVLLKKYITDEETVEKFADFLMMCDSVKFAKYIPSTAAEDQEQFIDEAAANLQQINKLSRTRTKTKSSKRKKKDKDADKVD